MPVGRAHVHPVLTQTAETHRHVGVVGGDHPAFTGGDDLAGVEGVRREVGAGTDRPPPIRAPDGARGVLDDGDAPLVRDLMDGLQVRRHAALMNDDDSPGPRRENLLDRLRRQVAGIGIDVGEHGDRPDVARDIGGRDEGERRNDHLVVRFDVRDDEGQVERRRA